MRTHTKGECFDYSFLIPTRGNVPGLKKLFDSIAATTSQLPRLEVILGIDEDDSQSRAVVETRFRVHQVIVPKGLTMGALNNACFDASSGRYIMLMNDDVLLRTSGWDEQVQEVFAGFGDDIGLVHVNDLLFREKLCTFPILSRRACLEIGLCPKEYRRYRIDDHIYDIYNLLAHLGHRRIVYLPDVVFEHENHDAIAAPAGNHQFASVDKKVYVPKAGIIEADAKFCDDHLGDRKQAALRLAALIQDDLHKRQTAELLTAGTRKMAAIADSHSYRHPSYTRVQTSVTRSSSNTRVTVAIVTADLSGAIAQQCLSAVKANTRNYDLVVLDNNRGPGFSHPREMNKILQACSTDFLALLDDDVIVGPGWLDGLLHGMDRKTGVAVPLHKDRAGRLSFSGVYFVADGRGTHAHLLDQPAVPRPVQAYCSAAMLIDMRKCGHIRMDESYHKYFFDLVHAFEVWESGYIPVCCSDVVVTHIGGATMKWGSAEANSMLERDRQVFVRNWLQTGRYERLATGPWRQHPDVLHAEVCSRQVNEFLKKAPVLSDPDFSEGLKKLLANCKRYTLIKNRLLTGLGVHVPNFAKHGQAERIALCCRLAVSDDPGTGPEWLIGAAEHLIALNQNEAADQLMLAGVELLPREVMLWRALGVVKLKRQQFSAALEAFEKATDLAPTDPECHGGQGMALLHLRRPREAVDAFREAARVCRQANPADPRIRVLEDGAEAAMKLVQAEPSGNSETPRKSQPEKHGLVEDRDHARDEDKGKCRRILLIPFECANWQNARSWSYTGFFALEEALRATGAECLTLPAVAGFASNHPGSWLRHARSLCAGKVFDQAWIWLTHNDYDPEFLTWLTSIAPVRLGILMESMEHTVSELSVYAKLPGRRERVSTILRHMTHVAAFDEMDAASLSRELPIRSMWCPPVVPTDCVCPSVDSPPVGPAVFNGTLYSPERRSFVESAFLRGILITPPLLEDGTKLPERFDAAQVAALRLAATSQPTLEQLHAHVTGLRSIRRELFDLWLSSMRRSYAVVNLPSVFKCYAGRVVESMAVGRPVISWNPPRDRTRALFIPDEEILLFDRTRPQELRNQIERLQKNPNLARSIAERARDKVLRYHTAEIRVRQILDWAESDVQPDYGEQMKPARSAEPANSIKLNSPRARGSLTMDAMLSAAAERVEQEQANPAAWVDLARTAAQAGQVEQCDSALDRALQLDPEGRDALKLLADLCARDGNDTAAVQAYSRILEKNPNDVLVLHAVASTLEKAGEWDAAFAVYDHLMKNSPADVVLAERVDRLLKARGLATNQSQPRADAPVPDNPAAAKSESVPPKATPKQPEALAKIELPRCARLGHLAKARGMQGERKLSQAWEETTACITSRPFHPEAYILLGEIALALGDVGLARQCAERARDMAPGWKPARKSLKRLPRHGKPVKLDWVRIPESSTPPRLSVCLIAKNEEKFIGQCLGSVNSLASQIVVVDTGSTDRTVGIAKEHGAEVHSFDWCDDFSAARNAALEHATGDWILMLDADEVLPEAEHGRLRKMLETPGVIAWRLPIVDAGREENGRSFVPRLFRNAPALFYYGRVHEQVFSSIEVRRREWGLENRLGDATLVHYGYTEQVMKDRNKIERNLRLLELAVKETPNEANLLMNYGLELVRSGRLPEGLEQYRAALRALEELPPEDVVPELKETLLTQAASQFLKAQHHEEVIQVLTSPLARRADFTASLHFALGLAYIATSDFAQAASEIRSCLAKRNTPALTPINPEIRNGAPHNCLAVCLSKLGQSEEAECEFRLAVNEAPGNPQAVIEFARHLCNQGRAVEGLQQLHTFVTRMPASAAAWEMGGQIALGHPEFLEVAVDWTAEATRLHPKHPGIRSHRVEALLLSENSADALGLCGENSTESPAEQALKTMCEVAAGKALSGVEPAQAASTSAEFLKLYRKLLRYQAADMINRVNNRLNDLAQVLPPAAHSLGAALKEAQVELV